ncbi:MAG: class II aldolase/adducin family protein [Promethearchaeia archaeon]
MGNSFFSSEKILLDIEKEDMDIAGDLRLENTIPWSKTLLFPGIMGFFSYFPMQTNPTSENQLHLRIYQERSDINAIIHSHAPFSTALAIAKLPIGSIVDEVIPFIGGCEVADYGMAGSEDLAENVIAALGEQTTGTCAVAHPWIMLGRCISR